MREVKEAIPLRRAQGHSCVERVLKLLSVASISCSRQPFGRRDSTSTLMWLQVQQYFVHKSQDSRLSQMTETWSTNSLDKFSILVIRALEPDHHVNLSITQFDLVESLGHFFANNGTSWFL
jgi:hypothetical protein